MIRWRFFLCFLFLFWTVVHSLIPALSLARFPHSFPARFSRSQFHHSREMKRKRRKKKEKSGDYRDRVRGSGGRRRKSGWKRKSRQRKRESTVGQNNQEYRLNYWDTCSSVCLFARTIHLFAGLLCSLPFSWDSD